MFCIQQLHYSRKKLLSWTETKIFVILELQKTSTSVPNQNEKYRNAYQRGHYIIKKSN
jgi:hypothetical protein